MTDPAQPREILTLTQAAEFLQLSTKTVAQLATDKELPARRIGREWRFSRTTLLRFIDGAASP
jgi:excisionase family DNA binding protein